MTNVNVLTYLQEKRASAEAYSIRIVSYMTLYLLRIAGSSELQNRSTREHDLGRSSGNTLQSSRSKCNREHPYGNILTF